MMLGSLVTLCASVLASAAFEPQTTVELYPIEASVIELTNAERARYGLPPLEIDTRLMQQARRHTAWMTNSRSMTHSSMAVAENIAMGQSTPNDVLRSWMNSSGHRANILNPGHRKIGVAAYTTPQGTIFWCQQFVR